MAHVNRGSEAGVFFTAATCLLLVYKLCFSLLIVSLCFVAITLLEHQNKTETATTITTATKRNEEECSAFFFVVVVVCTFLNSRLLFFFFCFILTLLFPVCTPCFFFPPFFSHGVLLFVFVGKKFNIDRSLPF